MFQVLPDIDGLKQVIRENTTAQKALLEVLVQLNTNVVKLSKQLDEPTKSSKLTTNSSGPK